MQNLKMTKTILLLMFSLFIVGFSINQARADVRINIGLGYPIGYVDHRHHGYIVHHHAPVYSYSRHHYHPPKKYYSKHRYHHPKSYRGHGHHRDYYRHDSRSYQHNYGHRHNRYYR